MGLLQTFTNIVKQIGVHLGKTVVPNNSYEKMSYVTHLTSGSAHQSSLTPLIVFFLLSSWSSPVLAEGSKQWSPSVSDMNFLKVNTGGVYAFGGYGLPEAKRLHIHIKDPSNEVVYIGLSRMVNERANTDLSTAYSFRIVSPSGGVVHGPHSVSSPNITSHSMAVAGPAPVSGGGYPVGGMWTFTPSTAGDHYIEFSTAGSIRWFDITVASTGAAPSAIDGRLWSRAWTVRADNGYSSTANAFDTPFNGALVAYDGKYATRIDFQGSGIRPLEGQFSFNDTGTGSSGNKVNDRKSVNGSNSGNPQHQIFLNLPDPAVYPLQTEGALQNLPLKVADPANPEITVEVTQPGRIEVLLDFGGGNKDKRLFADVVAGSNQIPWDGKTGAGVVVTPSDYPIPVSVSYTQGETHFTAYDVEGLDNGFQVFTQTSAGTVGPRLQFWDDSGIPDSPGSAGSTDAQVNVDAGATTRRRWNNNSYGDLNTINTWWFSYRDAQTSTVLLPGDYGDAPDTYGNAAHKIPNTPTVYLGSVAPDKEDSPALPLDGSGDDNDTTDDEDAISSALPNLIINDTDYSLDVICVGEAATVAGWLDYNRNGSFDSGERSASSCVTGKATLSWTSITGMSVGTTYVRIRIASNATDVANPSTGASDGEVEDYALEIQNLKPTAFVCDGKPYTVIGSPSTLQEMNKSTLAVSSLGNFNPAINFNGIGYNTLDNFIYGYANGKIYRVGYNREIEDLGVPTGSGSFDPANHTGTMDTSGKFYGISANNIFIVDIGNNPSPNSLTYTKIARSGDKNIFADIAFSTVDGKLYGMKGGKLYQVDPVSGVGSQVSTTGGSLNGNAGGAWSTADGSVYLYNNSGGQLFKVDTSQTPSVVSNLGSVASNGSFDATACIPPSLQKDASVAETTIGDTFDYTFTISNPNATPISVGINDTLPAHLSFVAGSLSTATPGGGSVSTFSDTQLSIGGITVSGSNKLEFTVSVEVATSAPEGNIDNQASLTYGSNTYLSDDPDTAAIEDPTSVNMAYVFDYGDAPDATADFNYGIAKHIIPANSDLSIGSKKPTKNNESDLQTWTSEWANNGNHLGWFNNNKVRRSNGNGHRKKNEAEDALPIVVGDGIEEDGLTATALTWTNGTACTGILPDGTTGSITMTDTRYCITVKASNSSIIAAQLVGWIDFNQNGVFDDPLERSVVDVDADTANDDTQGNVPAGTNDQDIVLYWEGVTMVSGELNTFIRVRLTSDPEFKSNNSPDPIGVAINGEVEDTNIGIYAEGTDYGDAPDSYGDASHIIELDAYMGTTIDHDDDTQNTANGSTDGTGDDNDGFDDDDGVASFPILRTDSPSYSVDVVVTSPATTAANLVGWIDFDNSGTFDNDEAATVAVPQNITETAVTLTWSSLPVDAVIASTYARLRLTTDISIATGTASTSLPTGLADYGEVEDYTISIVRPFSSYVCPSAKADLWFANDESGSVSASEFNNSLDFLYHISDEFIYDDVTGVKAGITGWGSNVASAEVLIPISELFGDPGDSGLISTSVVTNNNGTGLRELYDTKKNTSTGTRLDYATTYLADLINAGNGRRTGTPQIAVLLTDASSSQLTSAGSGGGSNWINAANALRAAGPDGTRLVVIITEEAATAYNSGAAKAAVDAVVGDGKLLVVPTYADAADPAKQYIDSVVQTVCATIDPKLDYGDAPDTYTDASHDIFYSSDVYLGAIDPDQDTESQNASNAGTDGLGDDNDGTDDEDGLSTLPELTDIDNSYELDVVVTNNRGDTAYLVGWIDINSNGTFESSEATTVAVSDGTNGATVKLNWTNLASSIKAGTSQIRLRLTTDTSVATGDASTSLVGGNATDGEVEDYEFTIEVGGFPVKGRVYKDTNVDGINDVSEAGISGLPVVLLDVTNSTCVSTRTNADGDYEFFPVIPGDYQLYEASQETIPTPQNCDVLKAKDPAGYRSTTSNVLAQFSVIDAEITGKDFGDVGEPAFEPDNTGTILAGNVEFYAHTFTVTSTGTVSFVTNNSGSLTPGWSSVIYEDTDCNGQLDGVEANTVIASNLPTITGQEICLINKVYAPSEVNAGETFTNIINATFDFNSNALAGSTILKVTDLSKAAANDPLLGSSKLELRKTVQNITQNSLETATQNQAEPSDVLRYRIYYSNTGTGLITDLKINDAVPAFTSLNGVPTCETPLPASLTSCVGNVSGSDIEWVFGVGDSLKGGAQGMVSYEVTID